MKQITLTTSFIITCLLLVNTIQAKAFNPIAKNSNAKETMRREIIRNINCPDFITENNQLNQVKAIVAVTESGIVNIEEINSGNVELKDYVLSHLQNMKISNNTSTAEKFVLVINFKID